MTENDFEVEIHMVVRGDNLYAATIIPLRVTGYASTRESAIVRAREVFANLVAAYEADGNLAQLVEQYERLKRRGGFTLRRSAA